MCIRDRPKGQDSSQAVAEEKGKEKIKVTFIKNEWHGDPNDMEIYKILEEKTGVEVEWQVYSAATWEDKKNLILSSGDLPDVFYMNAVNVNDVTKYAPQGMFLDLTDYIEAVSYTHLVTERYLRINRYGPGLATASSIRLSEPC